MLLGCLKILCGNGKKKDKWLALHTEGNVVEVKAISSFYLVQICTGNFHSVSGDVDVSDVFWALLGFINFGTKSAGMRSSNTSFFLSQRKIKN